jgi:hypothetical protein
MPKKEGEKEEQESKTERKIGRIRGKERRLC